MELIFSYTKKEIKTNILAIEESLGIAMKILKEILKSRIKVIIDNSVKQSQSEFRKRNS